MRKSIKNILDSIDKKFTQESPEKQIGHFAGANLETISEDNESEKVIPSASPFKLAPKNYLNLLNNGSNSTSPNSGEGSTNGIWNCLRKSVESPRIDFKKFREISPSRRLVERTSSFSPSRRSQNNSDTEDSFPITSQQALHVYGKLLSDLDKRELKAVNQVYYLGNFQKRRDFCDDKGFYKPFKGDHLIFRFEIEEVLGKGSFGIVLKCKDHKRKEKVAVKVLRKKLSIKRQGEEEVRILQEICGDEKDDGKCIVDLRLCFEARGHLCMVYELLSLDLYSFLKESSSEGMDLGLIKRIATQILIGIKHIHNKGFIHCDLKPENILLKSRRKTSIKIIDFGTSTRVSGRVFSYIQSRYYRAPEVILGLKYGTEIDIWSFGCILVELYRGYPIFPGETEKDQICRIIAVLGNPPVDQIESSPRADLFFEEDFSPKITKSRRGIKQYPNSRPLSIVLEEAPSEFLDLVTKCLEWNPAQRITAEQALKHPWIKGRHYKNRGRAR